MSATRFFSLLAAVSIISQFPLFHSMLAWQREDILAGQWWRILTGNLTHTNGYHLVLNMVALVAISFLFSHHFRIKRLEAMLAVSMIVIGLVMFASPYDWYAGLSGVLHSLFAWGAVKDLRRGDKWGFWLLLGLVTKVVAESVWGGSEATADLIGASVATEAHLAGAITGGLWALLDRSDKPRTKAG